MSTFIAYHFFDSCLMRASYIVICYYMRDIYDIYYYAYLAQLIQVFKHDLIDLKYLFGVPIYDTSTNTIQFPL